MKESDKKRNFKRHKVLDHSAMKRKSGILHTQIYDAYWVLCLCHPSSLDKEITVA